MTAPRPVSFIHFHGLTLLIVEYEGTEYVAAKTLTDLCGIDWRDAKRTLKSADSAILYGTLALSTPRIEGVGGTGSPHEVIYIRLDRARMLLARVNTSNMRAKSNAGAADALLALQVEWTEALHAYETTGIAAKHGHRETLDTVLKLVKARAACSDTRERAALTTMLHGVCASMGYPVMTAADIQPNLPGV